MKKLLTSAAVCGLVFAAAPAHAEIDLELGGYFKGYGVFIDQDDNADNNLATAGIGPGESTGEAKDFDFIRETEIHFTGETTLDNGLTVGFHLESDVDGADGNATVDESYAYFSGGWGRVNFGEEDGAAYLLQVAAPSADSNIDGVRQYVQPVNTAAALADVSVAAGLQTADNGNFAGNSFDYDADPAGKTTKLTYLSPILNGAQLGLSYTPDSDGDAAGLGGVGFDNQEDTIEETYEVALRYEGNFSNVGVILGAGYSYGENGTETSVPAVSDDREVFNVGADFDIGPFGIGAAYVEDNGGVENSATADDEETLVVGVDYTTGPFKLGASYFTQDNTFTVNNLDTERYSGGVTYTYGPGMTFRGSVGYIEHEATGIGGAGSNDIDATYVAIGTQINF